MWGDLLLWWVELHVEFWREVIHGHHGHTDNMSKRVFVPDTIGDGPLLVCGQSPGWTEMKEGRPFVGVDGKKLRAWLTQVGIKPNRATYTNVCQSSPDNDGTYKPTATEERDGYSRLDAMLEQGQFKVVLLVGAVAAHWKFPGRITELNGRTEAINGTTFCVVLHPGYHRNSLRHNPKGAPMIEAQILSALFAVAAALGISDNKPFLPEPDSYPDEVILC